MMAAWANLLVGLLLIGISIPMWLEKVPMNGWYGFRIAKSFESDENWYRINKFGGLAGIACGALITLVGVACFLWPPQNQSIELLLVLASSFLVLPMVIATLWYSSRF